MLDILKPFLEGGLINEETRAKINEAWDSKIKDITSQIRTEIREEFADRYAHDKESMVKTLDKMVADVLSKEIVQVKEERNQAAKLKIQTVKEMKGAAAKFNKFASRALAEELVEFAKERKSQLGHQSKLEKFVMSSLAEELNEFAQDKKDLVSTRVRLVAEAKNQLGMLKNKFVARSSAAVSKIVSETLNHELKQLHEDIKIARQNNFGRKIFEAFSTEYTGTHLNANSEVRNLRDKLQIVSQQLEESKKAIAEKAQLAESQKKEVAVMKSRAERAKVLAELLTPLEKSRKEVMSQLLENVQTGNLRNAYDKYLPAVLDNKAMSAKSGKTYLQESTGNKTAKIVPIDEDSLIDIKRLAGINN